MIGHAWTKEDEILAVRFVEEASAECADAAGASAVLATAAFWILIQSVGIEGAIGIFREIADATQRRLSN